MSHESHPIEPKGESHVLDFVRGKARIFAPLLAAVAVTGVVHKILFDDPMAAPKLAIEYAAGKGCEKPTRQELSAVRTLLENPEAVYVAAKKDAGDLDEWSLENDTANKYGLTLVETSSYMKRIDEAGSEAEVTEVVDDFMGSYKLGFAVEDPMAVKEVDKTMSQTVVAGEVSIILSEDLPFVVPSEPRKDDEAAIHDPRPSRLNTFRGAAKDFVDNIGRLPVEVVVLAKASSIDVKDDLTDGSLGRYVPDGSGEIQLAEESFLDGDQSVVTHELTHAIDYGLCHLLGSQRDPEFRGLNPPGFRYGQDNVKKSDMRSFAEPYGTVDVLEDKATVGEGLLTALFPETLTQSPAILAKSALLLARIEHRVPGAGRYIATLSSYYLGSMMDDENTTNFNPGDGGSG